MYLDTLHNRKSACLLALESNSTRPMSLLNHFGLQLLLNSEKEKKCGVHNQCIDIRIYQEQRLLNIAQKIFFFWMGCTKFCVHTKRYEQSNRTFEFYTKYMQQQNQYLALEWKQSEKQRGRVVGRRSISLLSLCFLFFLFFFFTIVVGYDWMLWAGPGTCTETIV